MFFKRFKDEGNSKNTSRGEVAEKFAQDFLKAQKLTIVETNYLTPRGELDIIAKQGDMLVFVEVRLRSNQQFGSAADSIDHRKQQRLIHAATHYLQSTQQWDKVSCQFDALCLTPDSENTGYGDSKSHKPMQYQVEWIRNAFSVG